MLADELVVLETNSPLWEEARPLLEIALQLEHRTASYSWHGWYKRDINAFLQRLPVHCSLLVGVWEVREEGEKGAVSTRESLVLGCVCEVRAGEVHSIRTFASLVDAHLPAIAELEPGFQHGLELMRVARLQVAPVAWALFTDRNTWDEWLLSVGDGEHASDKGACLATLALQGRCVLMGSQAKSHHQPE